MIINRVWEMPNKWTFKMKCVQEILSKYNVGVAWCDPFAGYHSRAEFTNDIEGRGAKRKEDALVFLKSFPNESVNGVLFDPPYSEEQCLRLYTPIQKGRAGRIEYLAKCRDEISRIIQGNKLLRGMAISFGWDSQGIGKNRGFTIIEILLICHGAAHNDTIVTVELKNRTSWEAV